MDYKTLLVTGGAGFIGTNFIRNTLTNRDDIRIVNMDALTYAGNPLNLDALAVFGERHCFVRGNICDADYLARLFGEHDFDGVIHFAAESHVDRSIQNPNVFIETNITGTFNLLEEGMKKWEMTGKENFRFVHVSTDEVYGSLGPEGRFTEESRYDPSSPYSASKAASDHLVKAYFRTYGFPGIVTNCSNNFGPYQFPEKLIPLMIMGIFEEKTLPVYGDGRHVRDWIYVTDHCDALLKVLEAGQPGKTYNIGGNSEMENIDIVSQLCRTMDRKLGRSGGKGSLNLIRFVDDRPGHDRRYAVDASKIQKELGWRPSHSFHEGLEKTVAWYLDHLEWVKAVQDGSYKKGIHG